MTVVYYTLTVVGGAGGGSYQANTYATASASAGAVSWGGRTPSSLGRATREPSAVRRGPGVPRYSRSGGSKREGTESLSPDPPKKRARAAVESAPL